jgi:hypothetical protein
MTSEVSRVLPRRTELCVRKKLGLLAWKVDGKLRFVSVLEFNPFIYRLSTEFPTNLKNLPSQFYGAADPNSCPRYHAKLNFHCTETPLINGAELLRFIEDCFRFPSQPEYIYRPPLFFASGRWKKPAMAWTELARSTQIELSPLEHLSKPVQEPTKESKRKFNPEPKTKKQEQKNEKVLFDLVESQKRCNSPAARKQYRKLRSSRRRAIQASGHCEEEVVSAIVERWPSQRGARRLEDICPEFLRWLRDHWCSFERQLKERKR